MQTLSFWLVIISGLLIIVGVVGSIQRKLSSKKDSRNSWADREIEIACAREESQDKDYYVSCYNLALQMYKRLHKDVDDIFDIRLVMDILNKLIEHKPLTPIEDTEDVWTITNRTDKCVTYQCERMSSLFKDVYADGTVKYTDVDCYHGINIFNPSDTYHNNLVQRIVDEMFPITMSYYPKNPIKVYCDDCLTDPKNGDFDTVAIYYAIKPNNEIVEINRFFKETPENWEEIDTLEYDLRKDIKL